MEESEAERVVVLKSVWSASVRDIVDWVLLLELCVASFASGSASS